MPRTTLRRVSGLCVVGAWLWCGMVSLLSHAALQDGFVEEPPTIAEPPMRGKNPLLKPDGLDASAGDAATPIQRPPLVREGAFLTDAAGRLVHDDHVGFWVFRLEREEEAFDRNPTNTEFIVLPCARLNQMQRTVESAEMDLLFLMTGRVFVYDDHNYLLPLSAPLLETHVPAADPSATGEAAPALPEDDGELSPEEMIERMKRDVPLARGLAPTDEAPATTPTTEGDVADAPGLVSEGTRLLSRRGHVMRSPRGGWRFVFEADAAGLADPPMTLLPCLLLEQLESESERRGDTTDALLMTGEVFTYRGANYLLPTMYRYERVRTNIRPE